MNRREFLMTTLAAFALSALPKLTFAENIPVSDAVKHKIDPKNKLGFGFMRLPLKNPEDQTSIDYTALNQMVDLFLQRGFTYFDTAWMYMGYESEVALRKSLVERHPRNKFTVASKLPIGYLKSKEEQEQIFNKQLEKTGCRYGTGQRRQPGRCTAGSRKNLQRSRTEYVGSLLGDSLCSIPPRCHDGFKRHEQYGTVGRQHLIYAKLQTAGRQGNESHRKRGKNIACIGFDSLHRLQILRRILPDENSHSRLLCPVQC